MNNPHYEIHNFISLIWVVSFGIYMAGSYASLNKKSYDKISKRLENGSFSDRLYLRYGWIQNWLFLKVLGYIGLLLMVLGGIIGILSLDIKFDGNLEKISIIIAISFFLQLLIILFFLRQNRLYKQNRLKFNNFIMPISMIGETKTFYFIIIILLSFVLHLTLLIRYIKII